MEYVHQQPQDGQHQQHQILCCQCGVPIDPNPVNTCISCLKTQVDITAAIPRSLILQYCRQCERYLQPPNHWLNAELESKELLGFILKRMKGLGKVRLIDAIFLWTEPHSRRIKVKLTVQGEVGNGMIVEQSCVVEAVVSNQQCYDCAKVNAKNTWMAVAQVRQKVNHKRTFLYLEQVILNHNAHADAVNIKSRPDGLDFYFTTRNAALKFLRFLENFVPLQSKSSEQLITQDVHSGSGTYKFTFSIEIVPICKDDLIFLPKSTSKHFGGAGPFLICTKVGTSLHFIDPFYNGSPLEMSASVFWRDPFVPIFSSSSKSLVEYYILDITLQDQSEMDSDKKYLWADALVGKVSDYDFRTPPIHARTHLGRILKVGDIALGYCIATTNSNNTDLIEYSQKNELPDVVLIRKSYAHLREPGKKRNWKLKNLPMETDEAFDEKNDDEERFMEEIEEDVDIRANINIYKSAQTKPTVDNEIEIPIEQLMDDLDLQDPNK
jgi:nonsense-mediated mRNA decay protein 3